MNGPSETASPSEERAEVWLAMADHFLDTETRHDIPLTALRCVEAELSVEQALHVWRHEVSPAVGANLLLVAGEWACWDRDWLVARIAPIRAANDGVLGRLRGKLRPLLLEGVWRSVERFLEALYALPSRDEQTQRAHDLAFLARHAFDFCSEPLAQRDRTAQERIRALYPEPITRLLEPALVERETTEVHRRLQHALRPNPSP